MMGTKESPAEAVSNLPTKVIGFDAPSPEHLTRMTSRQIDALADRVWENLTGMKPVALE